MNITAIKHNLIKQLNTPLIALCASITLIIVIIWTLWSTVQSIWLTPMADGPTRYIAPQHINLALLPNEHLMGASASSLGDLPLASLGVTLIGVFAGNQQSSIALIALSGGQSKIYHVGDHLAPNVVIEKILPYSVVVQHNGRLEKLAMPIQALQFSDQLPNSGLWN